MANAYLAEIRERSARRARTCSAATPAAAWSPTRSRSDCTPQGEEVPLLVFLDTFHP